MTHRVQREPDLGTDILTLLQTRPIACRVALIPTPSKTFSESRASACADLVRPLDSRYTRSAERLAVTTGEPASSPMSPPLEQRDLSRIRSRGITPEQIERQLATLREPPPPIQLARPCTPGDGIVSLDESATELERVWKTTIAQRAVKFVPASGVASRMFAFLADFIGSGVLTLEGLHDRAAAGEEGAEQTILLLENVEALAVFPELEEVTRSRTGLDSRTLRNRDPGLLLELLAGDSGLALDRRPKGLIPFHRYATGIRTAFEEHYFEGAPYLSGGSAPARFHFTVAAEHRAAFEGLLEDTLSDLEEQLGVSLQTDFSLQDPATDTIAIDDHGRLVRESSGDLLFRAGGHGSLLRNLERISDQGHALVFIKNIDNVAEASRHRLVATWKKILAGHALGLASRCFELLDRLERESDVLHTASAATDFVRQELAVEIPEGFASLPRTERCRWLRNRLDRPLRVCGVVLNRGEPGGGPFWVRRADGSIDGQIIEGAQVDRSDSEQADIWAASTHFNPVDIVCSLHDRHGRPYDLERFVDRSTYFITTKIHDGRLVRVLERPGLWNGSMAGWNTAFVEVPEATFTPVKTVLDLLRPEHRA